MAVDLDRDAESLPCPDAAEETSELDELLRESPPHKAPEANGFTFRMCKYCGNRIVEAFNKWGKPHKSGVYCSESCAFGVNGFDNKLGSERRHKTASYEPLIHDQLLPNISNPREELIESEKPDYPQVAKLQEAYGLIEHARAIDPRLPDILIGIANGETQEQAARRWKMSASNVRKVLSKFRASVSAKDDCKTDATEKCGLCPIDDRESIASLLTTTRGPHHAD